jgi:hypothetical protein
MLSSPIIKDFRALRKRNSVNSSRRGGLPSAVCESLGDRLKQPKRTGYLVTSTTKLRQSPEATRTVSLHSLSSLKNFACPWARTGTEQLPPPSQYTTLHTGKWGPVLPYSHHCESISRCRDQPVGLHVRCNTSANDSHDAVESDRDSVACATVRRRQDFRRVGVQRAVVDVNTEADSASEAQILGVGSYLGVSKEKYHGDQSADNLSQGVSSLQW